MALTSVGLTRYIYSRTYKAATLNFGILSTTGFTLSALCYTIGGQFELTGALLGGATSALLAGMTTASTVRSKNKLPPAIIAIMSFGAMIVHISTIEKLARRNKELEEMRSRGTGTREYQQREDQPTQENKQET